MGKEKGGGAAVRLALREVLEEDVEAEGIGVSSSLIDTGKKS